MARLSNARLLELLELWRNTENQGHTEKLPADVSLGQWRSFYDVMDGRTDTPAYMAVFSTLAHDNDTNVKSLAEILNELQDTSDKPLTGGKVVLEKPASIRGQKFVFTSAQNNTDVHQPFFNALVAYCKEEKAELIIGQFVYNKNGFQNGVAESDDIYYAKQLQKYFVTEQTIISPDLVWCGDLNILPTAKNPLTGFESYTGTASSIIPHAKIALESIATPKNEQCKMLYSTGTVTQHNYIQKKAGQLAQHEHCYGALVVEISESGEFFARQIQTDDSGCFYDLTNYYGETGVIDHEAIPLALNLGDIHAEKSDDNVLDCCEMLIDWLEPEHILFHDLFDMTARNHHNSHFLASMHYQGLEGVEDDIEKATNVLNFLMRPYTECHVIESNHDLALESWLNANDYDFRADPINASIYLKLQSYVYNQLEEHRPVRVLEHAIYEDEKPDNLTFLNTDDSLVLGGVECGYHGHIGCNGSRGNPNQFRKLNRPMNTGHTHTASIKGSIYTAGVTGSMDMGYNKGPSSWSHSHILTYPNGFRTIITMKMNNNNDYEWRA